MLEASLDVKFASLVGHLRKQRHSIYFGQGFLLLCIVNKMCKNVPNLGQAY